MHIQQTLENSLKTHSGIKTDLSRKEMIKKTVERGEALVAANGCLATWTRPESTGRSPKDTLIVHWPELEKNVDWDSPNNIPVDPETFQMLWADALDVLKEKDEIFVTNRVVGANSKYALPIKTITSSSLVALFTINMFRPVPEDIHQSVFSERGFILLSLPYDKLNSEKYKGRLRQLPNGKTTDMAIAIDFANRVGLVFGSAYQGSGKKLIFTVMNYYLPLEGILPLHCSANESTAGDVSLFLGLSGTGKTTLSADASRALFGDDEHGWNEDGIANFEYGCYAKLINLDPEKEPEIHKAVFHKKDYLEHGAIVENALMWPDGTFDLFDDRLTPNSRASYPLASLTYIKPSSKGGHPKTIIFLTADANGVLPPVSKLGAEEAMLWFLMGYTSKLAGTETGIVDPVSTFSRFFGQPFMPCLPHVYADMLGEYMRKYGAQVFLVNTGWSGGPFGIGKRMDITVTRTILNAALDGKLEDVEYHTDKLFHLQVPKECPGIAPKLLDPAQTWQDKNAYRERAEKLAREFSIHFDKAYGNKDIDPKIKAVCPGK
ncbi:phosphoenolpyruvate carboxykinase (ATP) [candidate division KSB1 bacterium]|nr:phosphoenolpyruvate carboxykinase (ATP) [candidate division KSB1 bacterium]